MAHDKKTEDLLIKVRQRFKLMLDADERNRRDALDDFSFIQVPDGRENNNTNRGQWDQNMLKERGNVLPMYSISSVSLWLESVMTSDPTHPARK